MNVRQEALYHLEKMTERFFLLAYDGMVDYKGVEKMTAFLISASELREKLGSPDLVLLDVRANLKDPLAGRVAFAAGHIPGAAAAHRPGPHTHSC